MAIPLLKSGDFLVISETPIAISQGRLVDEALFKPDILSFFLADIWSKYLWGYLFGPLLRVKKRTVDNLRKLPPEARAHKKVILNYYGWKHALKPASEAGVDLSNAPGTMVSLLPENPQNVVREINNRIRDISGKEVTVMIIDTDVTYQLKGLKFTSLPQAIKGIRCDWGVFAYILGRFCKIKRPTPLAVFPYHPIGTVLDVADIAESYHKSSGNMETVHDITNYFEDTESLKNITVEMLDSIPHTPAIIVRGL